MCSNVKQQVIRNNGWPIFMYCAHRKDDMIFYNADPSDRDFLDENNQIRLSKWKDYWRSREQDPETRREVRVEKSETKKRIHKQGRRRTKSQLRDMIEDYRV